MLVPVVDSSTEIQQVEAPRVITKVSAETIDAVVATDTFGSLNDRIII